MGCQNPEASRDEASSMFYSKTTFFYFHFFFKIFRKITKYSMRFLKNKIYNSSLNKDDNIHKTESLK